jgi:hypothetical protein
VLGQFCGRSNGFDILQENVPRADGDFWGTASYLFMLLQRP